MAECWQPPVVAATSLKVLDLLDTEEGQALRTRLKENTVYFRSEIQKLGFELIAGEHPIIPIMLGDAPLAVEMADRLLKQGIYVIGFSFPVVPMGKARIRVQISAAHTSAHLDRAIEAFAAVGKAMKVI